jgi:hypothetical protein
MKKKEGPKGPNIFDFLNQIYNKTLRLRYDKKAAPAYMLSMWLSHDSNLIDTVQKINGLQFHLPDDIIYKYYFSKIPKGRRFIRWTKKDKEDKKKLKELDSIMIKHNLSKNEAKRVLMRMKENEILEKLFEGGSK